MQTHLGARALIGIVDSANPRTRMHTDLRTRCHSCSFSELSSCLPESELSQAQVDS